MYDMCWQDIDPEKAVDKPAIYHEENKAGDEECPCILREPAGKRRPDLKNSVEHEGFCNAVADTEHQNSQDIELAASVGCGM